ncbi:MAG: UDP-glucose 4-epimerase GalE, partial [Thermobifida fusca]
MSSFTVAVTGGAGYVGSHVCKELARNGYRPVVIDDLSTGHRWAVRWGPLVVCDIRQQDVLTDVLREYGVRAIVHCAGRTLVGESMRDPGAYFDANVGGSLSLLNAAVKANVRYLVFSSSAGVYGHPDQIPIPEHVRPDPQNPYGESKLLVERMIRWFAEVHGLRAVSLRYFNAAGADPDGEVGECHDPETHLIPSILNALFDDRPVSVFGCDYPTPDGTAIRDYVHVSDLATAHVRALQYLDDDEAAAFSIFNLGSGRGFSVTEVIAEVEQVTGRSVKRVDRPRRPGDPPILVADITQAVASLAWKPTMD